MDEVLAMALESPLACPRSRLDEVLTAVPQREVGGTTRRSSVNEFVGEGIVGCPTFGAVSSRLRWRRRWKEPLTPRHSVLPIPLRVL